MLESMHTVKKQNNLMEKHCYLFQFKKYAKAVLGDVLNLNLFQLWMYIKICLSTELDVVQAGIIYSANLPNSVHSLVPGCIK